MDFKAKNGQRTLSVKVCFDKKVRDCNNPKLDLKVSPGPGTYDTPSLLLKNPSKPNSISIKFGEARRFERNERKVRNQAEMYSKFEWQHFLMHRP